MLDQDGQPIEVQRAQQDRVLRAGDQQLSSAQYVLEVSRHLSRMRRVSLESAARRI